jgi:hypothetical protein
VRAEVHSGRSKLKRHPIKTAAQPNSASIAPLG